MKIVLTGATGRVGGAVLQHCLLNPAVTSLVVLSRRPLEGISNPKLTTIIHTDYLKYDEKVIEQMKGAQGCIWALGAPTGGKQTHILYPRAAIEVFLTRVVPSLDASTQLPFRFVLTSGGLMPYLASSWLFFLGPWRTLRLDFDNEVLALEKQHPGKWESFVSRPWHVVDEPLTGFKLINEYILRPELGAAMTDAVLNGGVERIMTNEEMKERGQRIVSGMAKQ